MMDDDSGKSDPPRPLIATGAVAWICASLVLVALIAGATVLGIYSPEALDTVIHAASAAAPAAGLIIVAICMILKS